MFTQSEVTSVDHRLQTVEELTFPLGVVLLATGRLFEQVLMARIGGALVVLGLMAVTIFLARRLLGSRVGWTPMLRRYAVAVIALAIWGLGTAPAWVADPLSNSARFGFPGSYHLLLLGIIGFVVLGTLYHVIPFIIWLHRYSDDLGLKEVPMIDDLYSDRLARADLVLIVGGTLGLITSDLLGGSGVATTAATAMLALGCVLFALNMSLVVYDHSPHSLRDLFLTGSTH